VASLRAIATETGEERLVGESIGREVSQPKESVGTKHVSDRADTAKGSDEMVGFLPVRGEFDAKDVGKATHLRLLGAGDGEQGASTSLHHRGALEVQYI
jgi:hypothetical protein